MPTVVILHGWGQDKRSWEAFSSALNVPVAVFDLPGFGTEPLVSGDWGVPEFATWVQNKIESENLTNVILLGHSFGGRVAAHIAAMRPPWLTALVLYAVPCLYRPSLEICIKKKIAAAAKAVGLGSRYRGNQELNEASEKGLGDTYRRVVNFDQAEALKKIAVPTLLLWGQQDTDVSVRIAEEMQQLIPGSHLEVLPNLGHNAHLENPNLFFGVVKKYVENL